MRGVHRIGKKFRANIYFNGKRTHLGMFETEIEAAKAYDEAALKHHGDAAITNFGRKLTVIEEQVFRLVSGDFYNMSYKNAAIAMGWYGPESIIRVIKRIQKKCPSLFPLKMKSPKNILQYETWMDSVVKTKF